MMGPDDKIVTGGASMTTSDWNSGAKKGRGLLQKLFGGNNKR